MVRPLFLLLFLVLLVPAPASAQDGAGAVPRVEDAELIFDQAVEAFEDGDYGMAYRRFRLVFQTFDLNRKTTAAYLMAAKSLYRQGEYRQTADLVDTFAERYPTSGYVEEARRLREFAVAQLDQQASARDVIDLGILLPRTERDAALAQALFNGIRMAVEEVNADREGPRVRMIFRDSDGTARGAAAAVRALADAGAEAVIGPLYSGEARAAAQAAEQAGLVLVAPMATDEDVSEDRDYVFQANPTITERGRAMARFAMQGLLLDEFGIVAARDPESLSERMAEGFQEEALGRDARIDFYTLLQSGREWASLVKAVGPDTLSRVEAIYLPVSGGLSARLIEAALTDLQRSNVNVRVLGNAEWHDLPFTALASRFEATYTNDFYVDPSGAAVRAFETRYRELAGEEPDESTITGRLAYTGYDVARFLLERLAEGDGVPLTARLRQARQYQGLGLRIDFVDSNVNQAMYFHRYRDGRLELIR